MKKTLLWIAAVGMMAPALIACETATESAVAALSTADEFVGSIFGRKDVNLNEKSYAAADYLASRIKGFVPQSAAISVEELTLEREASVSSELGRLVPRQAGERLRQLGYNVKPPDWMEKGTFILGGTYDRDRDHATVNLTMTRASDGKTVGAFRYKMPMTREIGKLAEPAPRIIRMSE